MKRTTLSYNFFFFAIFFIFQSFAYAFNGWHFAITPFLWNIHMHGQAQLASRKAHIDQTKPGGMLWLNANNGKFGLFTNIIYLYVTKNIRYSSFNINATNQFGVYTFGASYQVYQYFFGNPCYDVSSIVFEPYMGVRYTVKNTHISLKNSWINYKTSNNKDWADPIIGLRLYYLINQQWHTLATFDLGGTSPNTQYSYNALALLGYKPPIFCKHVIFYLGYQIFDQHYISGKGFNYFDWNIKLYGPLGGITIQF